MLLEIFHAVYEQHINYEICACIASESEDRNFASGAVFMLSLPVPLSLTPFSLYLFLGIHETCFNVSHGHSRDEESKHSMSHIRVTSAQCDRADK